jgi:hypothetical protein
MINIITVTSHLSLVEQMGSAILSAVVYSEQTAAVRFSAAKYMKLSGSGIEPENKAVEVSKIVWVVGVIVQVEETMLLELLPFKPSSC